MADIEIRGAVKRFSGIEALKRFDLDIRSGEFFTLLGPSGCGKTTLLRMIAGFHDADEGSLAIAGEDASRLPPWRRETGMVFQNYAVFPHLDVFENVGYGLRQRKLDRADLSHRVAEALAQVQLGHLARRMPDQLSGGQKQRVALARALVIRPRVLLMDEPLSNLDARLRLELRRDIRLLQQDLGITTVYVTHDQEEALAISDRIMVMEAGTIRQIGSPHVIYDAPAHVFVAGFIGACALLDGQVTGQALTAAGARLPAAPGLPDGAAVTVAIRPQGLVLEPSAAPDRLSGRARLASFLGAHTRLTIALDSGGEIEADLPRSADAALPEQGAPVHLSVQDWAVFDARPGPQQGARLA